MPTLVTATPNPGPIAETLAWGVQIAKLNASITGSTVWFLSDCYGLFGQVIWISIGACQYVTHL